MNEFELNEFDESKLENCWLGGINTEKLKVIRKSMKKRYFINNRKKYHFFIVPLTIGEISEINDIVKSFEGDDILSIQESLKVSVYKSLKNNYDEREINFLFDSIDTGELFSIKDDIEIISTIKKN